MLPENFLFNHRSIRSYTLYECAVDESTLEKEVSFHVDLGPHAKRADVFPVYEVPEGKIAWLSDCSFNGGWIPTQELSVGASLGRITPSGHYVYALNAAVYSGDMEIDSLARPIRYIAREWIAACFRHQGIPTGVEVRATFRFTEQARAYKTRVADWTARAGESFDIGNLVWKDV